MGVCARILGKKAHYCMAHSLDLCAKCCLEIGDVKDLMSAINMYISMGNSSLILSRLKEAVPDLKVSDLNFALTRWNSYVLSCETTFPNYAKIRNWASSEYAKSPNTRTLQTMNELFTENTRILLNFLNKMFNPICDLITIAQGDDPKITLLLGLIKYIGHLQTIESSIKTHLDMLSLMNQDTEWFSIPINASFGALKKKMTKRVVPLIFDLGMSLMYKKIYIKHIIF